MIRHQSIIDFIEEYLQIELSFKNLEKLRKLSNKERLALCDAIEFKYHCDYWFVDWFEVGELIRFEVDPSRYAFLTDSQGQIDSYEIWRGNDADYIKKLLLYYPKISILDPIDDIMSIAYEYPDPLIHAISLLLPARDLITSNTIRLIPGQNAKKTIAQLVNVAGMLNPILSDINVYSIFEAYDSESFHLFDNSDLDLPGGNLHHEELNALESVHAKTGLSMGLITYCAIVLKEFYIKEKISDISQSNIAINSDKEKAFYYKTMQLGQRDALHTKVRPNPDNTVSPFLLELDLPNISGLSWNDICSIRKNDEDFYFWRSALKEAAEKSYDIQDISSNDFYEYCKANLLSRSRLLKDSIKNKASLKLKLIDIGITTSIGFAAGILGGDTSLAFCKAALAGALSLLYSFFMKQPSKGEGSICKHFSTFLDSTHK